MREQSKHGARNDKTAETSRATSSTERSDVRRSKLLKALQLEEAMGMGERG